MQKTLTEKEAEDFLEKAGFKVIKRAAITDSDQVKALTKTIDFPWAMKLGSAKVAHKAQVGGVILNIENSMAAQEAFDKLSKIDGFEEAIVQEMFSGEEAIIGIKKTPEFGHVILFGHGGINVEKEKDVSFRVLPASKKELKNMIKETKFYKTLEEKDISIEQIEKNIDKIQELVKKHSNIIELDINPLTISKTQAKVIDARIIMD
ncbi:MAG: acetate--CoA ligase family protein [Nanoarchaeota archaeon]